MAYFSDQTMLTLARLPTARRSREDLRRTLKGQIALGRGAHHHYVANSAWQQLSILAAVYKPTRPIGHRETMGQESLASGSLNNSQLV
jgi:hypothetical protein